jgi:aminoglycoside phosphotransferase family enzyme
MRVSGAAIPGDDQSAIVEFLSNPANHEGQAGAVERIDTHAAMVFLVGDRAYKVKRAVRYDYLDFSTLEHRHAACEAEFRLNRRTAAALYLGVTSIARGADGVP